MRCVVAAFSIHFYGSYISALQKSTRRFNERRMRDVVGGGSISPRCTDVVARNASVAYIELIRCNRLQR